MGSHKLYVNVWDPITHFSNSTYVKDLYIFVEGPDDDSNGIETCSPSPINNILVTAVFD